MSCSSCCWMAVAACFKPKNIFLNLIWIFSNIENDKRTEDRIQSEERICTQRDFWLWLYGIMLLRKTDWSGLVRSFPIIMVCLYFIFVALLTAEEQNQDWNKFGYSHLSNNRGGGGRVAKSINLEVGINVEGEIFWKKTTYIVHRCNERRV